MGTLIGADLLNLDKISGLGAPVASIGGAGTFDGIFLTGILAVLLAGIASPSRPRPARRHDRAKSKPRKILRVPGYRASEGPHASRNASCHLPQVSIKRKKIMAQAIARSSRPKETTKE